MKPGTSTNVRSGILKASQKRTNRAPFTLALMSSVPAHTDGAPVEPGEADDEVLGPALLHLEELTLVHHAFYGAADVVGTLGEVRDQGRKALIHPLGVVRRSEVGRALQVVLGEEREQIAHVVEAGLLVG